MNPEHPEQKKQELLENPAFQRFAACFELYQQLLVDADLDEEVTKQRMRDLHRERIDTMIESRPGMRTTIEDYGEPALRAIEICEEGTFSAEKFSEVIISSPVAQIFRLEWFQQPGRVRMGGELAMNDLLSVRYEVHGQVSLHIGSAPVKKGEVIPKLVEGLKRLATELSIRDTHVETILMKSWMLAPAFSDKIEGIFGNDVEVTEVNNDDLEVLSVQHKALEYNTPSLDHYLRTGEYPPVGQITMSREDFVQRFSQ